MQEIITQTLSWIIAIANVISDVALAAVGILLVIILTIYIKKIR